MAGYLVPFAISVSPLRPTPLHSRSVTEPRQELGRMWLKGREGEGAAAARASAPETLKQGGFSSLLLSAQGCTFWKLWDLPEPPFIDTEGPFCLEHLSFYISDGILRGGPLFLF